MAKAKYICTMGGQYYWDSIFEYRGHEYEVHYSNGYSAFKQPPAYVQHREAQERIDRMIDNPVVEEIKPSGFDMDEIFELCGWN